MQQSSTISTEQESLSITISQNSSENSLNNIDKLKKWYRIAKCIIQFFRFIKIPILRSRFIDMISHMSTDGIEELNNYKTNKIQEDLLFLDDINRYQEIFNTFSSFSFTWQNKEFKLVKLKANYIYDHYMSTSEAILKTNIPTDIVPIIYNRINSSKIFSSTIYLNLFNDAEKFIIEKILMIYMRHGLNCFSISSQRQSIPIMNRSKENNRFIIKEPISTVENIKEINKIEKFDRPNMVHKDIVNIKSQYDELIIPNWTYSTDLGVIYNPIYEKRVKVITRNIKKKRKDFDSTINTIIKQNDTISNEIKLFDSTLSKPIIPILSTNIHHSSKYLSHVNNKSIHFISTHKSLFQHKKPNTLLHSFQNSHLFPSSYSYQSNNTINAKIFNKRHFLQKVFICKIHSSLWPKSYQSIFKNEVPYRMAFKPQPTYFNHRIQQSQQCNNTLF